MEIECKLYPKISLKAARVNADLSQDEASQKIGISKSTLQGYEKGKTVSKWDIVDRILNVYDFPSELIFFGNHSL